MEGRFPPGIRCVFSRCSDPAQEEALTDWYRRVHFPDILRAGVATHALRYRNAEPQDGEPDYLVIYEIATEDFSTGRV